MNPAHIAWVAILTLLVATETAASNRFTGQGQAVIIEGNRSSAEQIARTAARTQALSRAMESYVSSGQVDRHQYNLKKGELLRGDHGFILKERVLSRDVQDPILRLSLQIEVDMDVLGRSLGTQGLATRQQVAQKKRNRPTTMVIVAEEINGAMNSFPYSVQVIQGRLLESDYQLVDQTAAARASKHDQAVQAMLNNDTASARALALQFDAGMMITGRAVVQKSGIQGGGMQTFGANVALSAIAADSGRILASASADGTYPHVNAITGSRLAVEEASRKAMDQVLARLDQANYDLGTALRLSINGVNYEQLAILKQILERDFPQVMSMDTRGFTGDIARLNVELAGSVVDFAEALSRKKFRGFRLRVLSQSSEKLDVVLVKG